MTTSSSSSPSTSSPPSLSVRQPSFHGITQITRSLYIGNGVAANSRFILSSSQITMVINASVEVVNTYYDNIQYLQVPVTDTPTSHIYGYFDLVADQIHSEDMRQGRTLLHCVAGVSRSPTLCLAYLMKYHAMTLRDAHKWIMSLRPIIRPNNGFWEQLIHYESKLFNKNSVKMINSPVGVVPDVYEEEIQMMRL
ncbi:dual specificity protein phosphatase 18-like [Ochotona curzoniae]|uniref:dual specificity protein phosphatase 18-like n=1 Tax=Ochotona curzoniae TaxID=130825 RepID=UPI001B351C43|nr:dual specificity protein phosphatase 18-like [Ochotona curzoniae]